MSAMETRVRQVATWAGLTLEQLAAMRDNELRMLPNFGRRALEWLRETRHQPLASYDDHALLAELARRLRERGLSS